MPRRLSNFGGSEFQKGRFVESFPFHPFLKSKMKFLTMMHPSHILGLHGPNSLFFVVVFLTTKPYSEPHH